MTKTMRLAVVLALLVPVAFSAPVAADSQKAPPGTGYPAEAMRADPNGCYYQDIFSGVWPCRYQFPDFCINPDATYPSGAYFAQPCTPSTLSYAQWCKKFASHPNCTHRPNGEGLPKTGIELFWLVGVAAFLSVAGLALQSFAHRRKRNPYN